MKSSSTGILFFFSFSFLTFALQSSLFNRYIPYIKSAVVSVANISANTDPPTASPSAASGSSSVELATINDNILQSSNEIPATDASTTNSSPTPSAHTFSNTTSTKQYFCQHGVFAGNSNRLLSLARGKNWAEALGLEYAFIFDPKKWEENRNWYYSWFEPMPGITTVEPGEVINCVVNRSAKEAFYYDTHRKSPSTYIIPQLTTYFVPKREIRVNATNAIAKLYGNTSFLSVHRRNHKRQRASKYGRRANCSKDTLLESIDMEYSIVQEKHNPSNLPVVLFTDSMNRKLDDTFPVKDENSFKIQMWMMALAEEHVGSPLSTVDLVLNQWRYAMGKSVIRPVGCYSEFKQEYVRDPADYFV